jgi:hypothetical protein
MIISHKFKFLFFSNGKTGTTSIENALKPYNEASEYDFGARGLWAKKHIPPAIVKALLPSDIWDKYLKIMFVRHPVDWFISQYKHNFRPHALPKRAILAEPLRIVSIIRDHKEYMQRSSLQYFDTEDVDFLYEYLRRFRGLPGTASLFQTSYAFDMDGNCLVDFIGKFERLHEDVEQLKKRIGIDFELPHLNRSPHRTSKETISKQAILRIGELYEMDFRNFNYELEGSETVRA